MRSSCTLVLALIGLVPLRAESTPPVTLSHSEQLSLHSSEIGQQFDLLVRLPDDYATSGKSYPVLYVLDGWHFPLFAFLANNNIYSKRMPAVIMVNVSYPAGVNPVVPRVREFTPTFMAERKEKSGGAPAFLRFLADEIIPLVDRTYRTDRADRALLGHSLGGLFALYTFTQRPELFHRIVAASPVVEWDHRWLFTAAKQALQGRDLPHPVRLDLSAADEEEVGGVADFAALVDKLGTGKLAHRFTLYPGENHNSVRMRSFPAGLYWVYADK